MNKKLFSGLKLQVPDFKKLVEKLTSKEKAAKNPNEWPVGAKLVRINVLKQSELPKVENPDPMAPVVDEKAYGVEFTPAEANCAGKTLIRPGVYVLVRAADNKFVFQHGHINIGEIAWQEKVNKGFVKVVSFTA